MMSEEMCVDLHKMLVSVYMKGKLEGQDLSKHDQAFKDSVEFLKQNGLKVAPDDLDKIMNKSFLTWSRHGDTSHSSRFAGYKREYHNNY